jgi:phosphonate degradation associated HDIG domain protein
MPRLASLAAIGRLYATRGDRRYDEGVSQNEHAVQCALLAEAAGAEPSLIAAALLHDIGHLFEAEEDAARVDGRHELAGARALSRLFDEAVREPIALHVAAKRYLCFADAGYHRRLSAASRRSLELQGGAFDAGQAAAFETRPYWRDAIAVRRFDDLGKRGERAGRRFADFLPLLRRQSIARLPG